MKTTILIDKKSGFKKIFLGMYALIFCIIPGFTQKSALTDDFRLVTDIRSAENVGYYPSVIVFADALVSSFPNSMYIDEALSAKGRALYYSGKNEQAKTVFLQKKQNQRDFYFLGRIEYDSSEFTQAVKYFYKAFEHRSENPADNLLTASILEYTGKALYQLEKFEELIPVYEYLVYSMSDVPIKEETAEILIRAYQKKGAYEKTIAFYNQIPLFKFSFNASNRMTIKAGDAYTGIGDYRQAFSLYERVMNGAGGEDLVIALQKAYTTAEKLGNADVEALLVSASSRLDDYPELTSEFWIRLGIAQFEGGEYGKALESFTKADTPNYASTHAEFYKAAVAVKENKPDISQDITSLLQSVDKNTDFYYQALVFSTYAHAQRKEWEKAVLYAADAYTVSPGRMTAFWYGLSLIEIGKSGDAADILENYYSDSFPSSGSDSDTAYAVAYARALLGSQKQAEALSLFEKITVNSPLVMHKENYAVSLLISKKSEQAAGVIKSFESPLAPYLTGTAAFVQKQWMEAESLFLAYLRTKPDETLSAYAQYNLAYSQYMQGKYEAAYDSFTAYEKLPQGIPYLWKSHYYGALSALYEHQSSPLAGWLQKAEHKARLSYSRAGTEAENQQAVLLLADILGEGKKIDEALTLLSPYTDAQDSFTVYALIYSADLYAKKKDIKKAVSSYDALLQKFPVHPLAEQALYAAGDLQFKNSLWPEAVERFTQYKRSYPQGLFITAALNYGAESCIQDKNEGQAILTYQELLKNYPGNSYEYSAMLNLVQLYRNKKEYYSALETAGLLIKKYPDQVQNSTIQRQMDELAILISGEDEKIAVALASYTGNDQEKTPEGRMSGFTLGELYIASPLLRADGAAMLKKMLSFYDKTSRNEQERAAYAHFLLGSYYREIHDYANASDQFLKSAELQSVFDAEKAAQSLYCAIEAFDCNALYADARSVYELLVQKFPQSKWVSRAAVLLRGITQ